MTLRILDHEGDADARLVAILLNMLGGDAVIITPEDELAMDTMMGGHMRLVLGGHRETGAVELKFVRLSDLPGETEAIN